VTSSEISPRNGAAPSPAFTSPAAPVGESTQELRRVVAELAEVLPGDLRRLSVRSSDREIRVEWSADRVRTDTATGGPSGDRPGAAGGAAPPSGVGADVPGTMIAVRAPLVGTYFAAPSPNADPFVRVGEEAEAGQTLAIIEAMKMMNPIVAPQAGVVVEVLVTDGVPVEYDQILLLLRAREQAT
jgi:acetyl-CoA carboxylase biotin carboxyl carrier protein